MRAPSRLSEARALVPAILAQEDSLSRAGDAVSAQVTSTGMALVALRPPGKPVSVVMKLPTTAQAMEALRRETRVLASLHADDRLGDWRALIPLPLAEGIADGRPYRVDAALPGAAPPPSIDHAERGRLREAAAQTIQFLHTATAEEIRGDPALAERWVDAPLRELWPRPPRRRRLRMRCDRLRDELHGAILGKSFQTCWVHGDFWLGNLLVSPDTGAIRGVVDWDAAAPGELASHDTLHLLLYTDTMATGRELGLIVRDRLRGGQTDRHALLLYWLRQVAAHARQQSRRSGPRYRAWERRNVHQVLAEL
jgi:aminoglycoside phosphotransferase (APT) family kinase protein